MKHRKLVTPVVVALGCLILIGGWLAIPTQSPQVNQLERAKAVNDPQHAEADSNVAGANAPEVQRPTAEQLNKSLRLDSGAVGVGTLNDQINRAFQESDGLAAANLASKLKECEINMMILTVESSRGAPPDADPALIALRKDRLLRYERMNSDCQTVPGDQRQVRTRLLKLAIQQHVIGAAIESFEAGSRDRDTLLQVVSDASAGDIKALTTLSMYDVRVFGATRDQQDAARYALKLASSDPAVGERVSSYLAVAESYGAPSSQFDFSAISAEARASGAETAIKVKERFLKPF